MNCLTVGEFIPFDDAAVIAHLTGRHVMGVYPLLEDENCWFLAVDWTSRADEVLVVPGYALAGKDTRRSDMNWEHLPLTIATVAVIATLSVCTAGIERHLDAVARTSGAVELAGIETRLQAIEDYACSMDRSLQSIDTTMLPPAVRLHKDRVQPCPGQGSP